MFYDISKNSAIAIFDSGVGGLTIMSEVAKILPCEDIIYFADAANCPYGGRSAQEIINLSDVVVEKLLCYGVKIIVVACNTATTNSIVHLRQKYPFIKFVGTEPAVKPAVKDSNSGIVGVLATKSTISSHQIEELTKRWGEGKTVLEQSGDGLVELVENGLEDSEEAYKLLSQYINPMIDSGIDYLALGCTHYPFMLNTIKKVIGKRDIVVINPAPAIARRVKQLLEQDRLINEKVELGKYLFLSSFVENDYSNKLEKRFNNIL